MHRSLDRWKGKGTRIVAFHTHGHRPSGGSVRYLSVWCLRLYGSVIELNVVRRAKIQYFLNFIAHFFPCLPPAGISQSAGSLILLYK